MPNSIVKSERYQLRLELKKKAELKIKNHLEKYGSVKNITITQRQAGYWWKQLNVAVFNGILKRPKKMMVMKVVGDHKTYGECWPSYDKRFKPCTIIRLKNKYETRRLFMAILIHEMVHQWEWETFENTSHHKFFYMWQDRIQTVTGLPLQMWVDDIIPQTTGINLDNWYSNKR